MENKIILRTALIMAMFSISVLCKAQKATEQFIPIGQSPGVSGKLTFIGNVESVNNATYSITIKLTDGTNQNIKIASGKTPIYLDKSSQRATNSIGDWQAIKPGMLIEVKYLDTEKGKLAEWVKVKIK